MNKLITALILAVTAVTAQAKDIATKEEYLCYVYFEHLEHAASNSGDRNQARLAHNAQAALSQKFILKISSIVNAKQDLNGYTGTLNIEKQKVLLKTCTSKL